MAGASTNKIERLSLIILQNDFVRVHAVTESGEYAFAFITSEIRGFGLSLQSLRNKRRIVHYFPL